MSKTYPAPLPEGTSVDPQPYQPQKAFVTRRIVTTVKLVARSASEAARLESQLCDHLATNKPIEDFNPV